MGTDGTLTLASAYIHGADPAEQERLALMNAVMNPATLAEAAPAVGERVLDVGSGLGHLSVEFAARVGPTGAVVGVERDDRQRARAVALAAEYGVAVDFRAGDARALPLADAERGGFDLAFTRFLLEHVPDPANVVAEMAAAVRPGGRVVLTDEDHDILRLWPEPPRALALWRAYVRSYDRLGNDPYVGRRLVALLHGAGLVPVRANWIFFGGCAGQPTFPPLVRNMAGILAGVRDRLAELGLSEPAETDAALEEFARWGERPDAALWFAISVAEGRRP